MERIEEIKQKRQNQFIMKKRASALTLQQILSCKMSAIAQNQSQKRINVLENRE